MDDIEQQQQQQHARDRTVSAEHEENCMICFESFIDVGKPVSMFPNCKHGNLVCDPCKAKQVDVLRTQAEAETSTHVFIVCPMCRSEISTVVCCTDVDNWQQQTTMDEDEDELSEHRIVPCPFLPNVHRRIRDDHVGRHLRKKNCARISRLKLYRNRYCNNHWFKNSIEAERHRCKATSLAEQERIERIRRRMGHETLNRSSGTGDDDDDQSTSLTK